MLKKLFAAVIVCSSYLGYSQNMDQAVIGNAGLDYDGTNANMSWTIGESVIVTHSTGSVILTQGFHQPMLEFTELENFLSDFPIQVYPNPSRSDFTIEIGNDDEILHAKIMDPSGKLIYQDVLQSKNVISAEHWASGIYILQLSNELNQSIKTFKIQKLN